MNMKPVLKVFVTEHCPGCLEARNIATRVEQDYPSLRVEVIDINDARVPIPDAVFATPTFMLNNRVVSLGNPDAKDIVRWVEEGSLGECRSESCLKLVDANPREGRNGIHLGAEAPNGPFGQAIHDLGPCQIDLVDGREHRNGRVGEGEVEGALALPGRLVRSVQDEKQ